MLCVGSVCVCVMVLSIKASMTPGLIGMGDELQRLCVRLFLAGGVERLRRL